MKQARERWSRRVLFLWLLFAVVLYLVMDSGPHTASRATEYWVYVGLALVAAMVLVGLLRIDQPGRSLTWRILTVPWLWIRVFPTRARRRRARAERMQEIYDRNSELYRNSVAWRTLPPQIRQAKGLPPYHDESQWR